MSKISPPRGDKLNKRKVAREITDPERMALEWVNHVDVAKGIFPKLPVHLRNEEELFDKKERSRIAFEQAKKVRELMTALNRTLCPNTEHEEQKDSRADNYSQPCSSKCWD
jgi:hypothetical protein